MIARLIPLPEAASEIISTPLTMILAVFPALKPYE
jgi:hypothetical protein